MTAIDREAVIAKARKVSQAVYLATDKGVADDIRDTIESLLDLVPEPEMTAGTDPALDGYRGTVEFMRANAAELALVPEPPSDDERDLIGLLASHGEYVEVETAIQYVRDADLSRRPLPSREQIAESVSVIRSAQAKAVTDGDQALADQLDATARWVLALFEKGAEG